MKECIACAEEIKIAAKLCRYCGTRQDDGEFTSFEGPESAQSFWNSLTSFETVALDQNSRRIFAESTTAKEILFRMVEDEDDEVRGCVASNPNAPPDLLTLLAHDENTEVRDDVARNPNTPTDFLTLLAKDEYVSVREGVASNPNTPPDFLKLLAQDENEDVRGHVASNPNTPPDLLTLLAQDEDSWVRGMVASNPNTLPDVLKLLAQDEGENVGSRVAENPKTSPDALSLVAQHGFVFIQPVRNSNATVKVLIQVLKEISPESFSGKKKGEIEESISSLKSVQECLDSVLLLGKLDNNYRARLLFCQLSNSTEVLGQLANDEEEIVRGCVASNPNTPADLLTILTQDANDSVREAVAENPNTPADLLTILTQDANDSVREAVAENPNTPPGSLMLLLEDDNVFVRANVAKNPSTSSNSLEISAGDADLYVRKAVAKNPNATFELLVQVFKGFQPDTSSSSKEAQIEDHSDSKKLATDPSKREPSQIEEIIFEFDAESLITWRPDDERIDFLLQCSLDFSSFRGMEDEEQEIVEEILTGTGVSRGLFDELRDWWFAFSPNPYLAALGSSFMSFLEEHGQNEDVLEAASEQFENDGFCADLLSMIYSRFFAGEKNVPGVPGYEGELNLYGFSDVNDVEEEEIAVLLQHFFNTDGADRTSQAFFQSPQGIEVLDKIQRH